MNFESIELGPISISLYSICILIGIILAFIVINKECKRNEISSYFISNLFFWTIIFGILGARAYYVLFNLEYYLEEPIEILKIWNGGLAIHGGIIAGLITIIIYCKKYKVNILKMLDIIVPGLILAQGIGRWGNFFNGEAYGSVVSESFLENMFLPRFIIDGMYIDGDFHHPTFLYESIFCIIGMFVLIGFRASKNVRTSNTTSLYLIWYGVLRFFIESLRTDSLMLGNIKVAQLVSIIMIIMGIILFIISFVKGKKYEEDKVSEHEIRI